MDGGRDLAASRRLASLTEKFHDKQYRDSYVASHNRGVLAQQMRNFRGDLSQADYAEKTGKQKTVIGRLESPAYAGWSLRTMLDIARKEDVAVIVRFVDFPTFLKYSGDLSDEALRPAPYDTATIEGLAQQAEAYTNSRALMALFSEAPSQQKGASAADDQLGASQKRLNEADALRLAANDDENTALRAIR
jgi:hypothetical protein